MRKNTSYRRLRRGGIATCLALALVAAGCGDDDDESNAATTAGQAASSAASATTGAGTATTGGSGTTAAPSATTGRTATTAAADSNVGEGKTIKVGGVFSATGAVPFANALEGAEAFWENVNADGGINGYQIEFTAIDDAFEAQKNAAAVQRLVGEGAVIIQEVAESTAPAGLQTARDAGIPLVVGYSQPAWFQTPSVYPIGAFYQRALARGVVAEAQAAGLSKFSLSTVAAPTAELAATIFREEIDAAGLELLEDISFAPTDTDFTGQTAQVANSDTEIVVCLCPQGAIGTWGQSAELQGYEGILFATGYNPNFKDLIGSWANGRLWTAAPIGPLGNDAARAEAEAIGKEFSPGADTSSINFAYAWAEAEIIAEAIRRVGAGEMTAENLDKALQSFVDWEGTYNSALTYAAGPNADPTNCIQLQVVSDEGVLETVGGERFQCFEGSVAPEG